MESSAHHAPDPHRWQALTLVCVAMFMTVLDVSIVNVALPSIKTALNVSDSNLQWVITAYAITFGGFLLLGGRTADLLGRRRMFMIGIAFFSLASLVCGLAGSIGVLVAARAVQGLGAAIISPATLSIIMTTFEEGSERNKALGIWGAMAGSGAAAGVLMGGILTKYAGWEWIFFVNVPVGALVLALTRPLVRESRITGMRGFDAGEGGDRHRDERERHPDANHQVAREQIGAEAAVHGDLRVPDHPGCDQGEADRHHRSRPEPRRQRLRRARDGDDGARGREEGEARLEGRVMQHLLYVQRQQEEIRVHDGA